MWYSWQFSGFAHRCCSILQLTNFKYVVKYTTGCIFGGVMKEIDFIIERSILKIGNKLNNMRTDDLKKYGITASQSETLLYFEGHQNATITELKEYLQISHQAARNIVERLKGKNLLITTTSKTDARANIVLLTDKGRELCRELKNNGTNIGTQIMSSLSSSEKKELLRMLTLISDNMQK